MSTPVKSLHAISGEMNLELRRQQLTLKYYYRIKSQLSNAATSITDRKLHNNKNITPPVGIRIRQLMEQNKFNIPNVSPAFSTLCQYR